MLAVYEELAQIADTSQSDGAGSFAQGDPSSLMRQSSGCPEYCKDYGWDDEHKGDDDTIGNPI